MQVKCPNCERLMMLIDVETLKCSQCNICHSILYTTGFWNGYEKAKKSFTHTKDEGCCDGFRKLFGTHRPGCLNQEG